jgi:acyl-[acyl-carrier-protein] desaturase
MAKEWMPHEYVPWRLGRDFDTQPWTPDQPRLTGIAQAAFEVNLLTEDNLPSYHRELLATFGRDGAWCTWSHRWTAEEGRHAVVLRDYLLVTRNIDPVALERGRMATVQQGWMPDKTALGCWPTRRSRNWPPGSRTVTPAGIPMTRSPTRSWCGWPPTRTCT